MPDSLYLTIDSSHLEINVPVDIVLPIVSSDFEKYTRVSLRHIYIEHESDIRVLFQFEGKRQPIYIHCSLLNKDDNLLNGEKCDVLGIIYPDWGRKVLSLKFGNNSFKLTKPDSKIKMTLTNVDGEPVDQRSKFTIIYELQFS